MEKHESPESPLEGVIAGIDICTTSMDGYITVPQSVLASRKFLIRDIMPNDHRYVVKGSIPIDKESGRMAIDTNDSVPSEGITKLAELEYRAAVMRVLYGIGARSVSGFVIDFRRIREPYFDTLGLIDGVTSTVFSERQELHGAELPLGVLFSDLDRTHYHGDEQGLQPALWLAQQVDALAIELRQKAREEQSVNEHGV